MIDLAQVRGQEAGKRALEVAAAGGHPIALVGPGGAGKSMLAQVPGREGGLVTGLGGPGVDLRVVGLPPGGVQALAALPETVGAGP